MRTAGPSPWRSVTAPVGHRPGCARIASATLFYAELPLDHSHAEDPRTLWESPFERHKTNVFYMEGFIDELAHAAGKDPLEYRRELIARNPPAPNKGVGGFQRRDNWLRALDMVEKMSGWGTPLPAGWARGIAIDDRGQATSCVCAHVHTVEVTKRGELKLHRSDIVFEQGFSLMNPLSVRKQIEGQIAWSYSDAMYQATTIKDGRAVERNFDTFQISRMNEYPKEVNIAFMKTDRWIEGVGDESLPHLFRRSLARYSKSPANASGPSQ